jgi:hypothetical protein
MAKIYSERLIGAFVSETKRDKILELAGIGKGKYYRLKSDPDFIKVVNERRAEIVREAVLRMEAYLSEDVDRLQEIIRDPETKDQIRINAIQLLMSQLANWRTITDIEGRLLTLETQVENQT